jgi:hypothetical protein
MERKENQTMPKWAVYDTYSRYFESFETYDEAFEEFNNAASVIETDATEEGATAFLFKVEHTFVVERDE